MTSQITVSRNVFPNEADESCYIVLHNQYGDYDNNYDDEDE